MVSRKIEAVCKVEYVSQIRVLGSVFSSGIKQDLAVRALEVPSLRLPFPLFYNCY